MSFREWRWVGGWTALVTVLITLPHWLASRFPPGGRQFLGSFWSPHDLSQYKAAMYEAAVSGSWLVHDRLTTHPNSQLLGQSRRHSLRLTVLGQYAPHCHQL